MPGVLKQVATLESRADAATLNLPRPIQKIPVLVEVEPLLPTALHVNKEAVGSEFYSEIKAAVRRSLRPAPIAYSTDPSVYDKLCIAYWGVKRESVGERASNSIVSVRMLNTESLDKQDARDTAKKLSGLLFMHAADVKDMKMREDEMLLVFPGATFARRTDAFFETRFEFRKSWPDTQSLPSPA